VVGELKALRRKILECKDTNPTFSSNLSCITEALEDLKTTLLARNHPITDSCAWMRGDFEHRNEYLRDIAHIAEVGSFDTEDIERVERTKCGVRHEVDTYILHSGAKYIVKGGGTQSDPKRDVQVMNDVGLIARIINEDAPKVVYSSVPTGRVAMTHLGSREGYSGYEKYQPHEVITSMVFETLIGDADRHGNNAVLLLSQIMGHIDFSDQFTTGEFGIQSIAGRRLRADIRSNNVKYDRGILVQAILEANDLWKKKWRPDLALLDTKYTTDQQLGKVDKLFNNMVRELSPVDPEPPRIRPSDIKLEGPQTGQWVFGDQGFIIHGGFQVAVAFNSLVQNNQVEVSIIELGHPDWGNVIVLPLDKLYKVPQAGIGVQAWKPEAARGFDPLMPFVLGDIVEVNVLEQGWLKAKVVRNVGRTGLVTVDMLEGAVLGKDWIFGLADVREVKTQVGRKVRIPESKQFMPPHMASIKVGDLVEVKSGDVWKEATVLELKLDENIAIVDFGQRLRGVQQRIPFHFKDVRPVQQEGIRTLHAQDMIAPNGIATVTAVKLCRDQYDHDHVRELAVDWNKNHPSQPPIIIQGHLNICKSLIEARVLDWDTQWQAWVPATSAILQQTSIKHPDSFDPIEMADVERCAGNFQRKELVNVAELHGINPRGENKRDICQVLILQGVISWDRGLKAWKGFPPIPQQQPSIKQEPRELAMPADKQDLDLCAQQLGIPGLRRIAMSFNKRGGNVNPNLIRFPAERRVLCQELINKGGSNTKGW